MIYLVMLVKTVAWLFAFWFGIRRSLREMLIWATAISVILTVIDEVAVAAIPTYPSILVSMLLYAMMSFFLFPLAWKMKNIAVSLACNVMGSLGSLAVVNFTMIYLTGQLTL
jgi:hypothetical protein